MSFLFYWGLLMLAGNTLVVVLLLMDKISLAQVPYFVGIVLLVSAALARALYTIHVAWEEKKVKDYLEHIRREAELIVMKYVEKEQREREAITMDDVVEALRKMGKEHIVEE